MYSYFATKLGRVSYVHATATPEIIHLVLSTGVLTVYRVPSEMLSASHVSAIRTTSRLRIYVARPHGCTMFAIEKALNIINSNGSEI